jgi:hypothetical protein
VAELPVLEVVSATHILADLTLGLGKVVHDYLRQSSRETQRINEMALATWCQAPHNEACDAARVQLQRAPPLPCGRVIELGEAFLGGHRPSHARVARRERFHQLEHGRGLRAFIVRSSAATGKRADQAVKFSMLWRRIWRQPCARGRWQTEIGFAAPDAVYVCPPLIITRAEIDELIQALAAALNDGYAEAVRRGLVGGAVKQAAVWIWPPRCWSAIRAPAKLERLALRRSPETRQSIEAGSSR